jgi:rSAM/selenodomain-associated transferase 2
VRLSIVIPTLNEAEQIAATLAAAAAPGVEVIVADGGSADATVDLARAAGAHVISASRGRARQMNAGAAATVGDVLLFLHADTRLPAGFDAAVAAALADPAMVGGRFDVRLEPSTRWLDLVAALINRRSRWSRIGTGDQALFVRRAVFEALGGFPDLPLMEDLALSIGLKRRGGIACLRQTVATSSRRWQKDGPLRTVLLMWWLRFLFWCGVPAERLKRRYADTR